MNQYRIRAIPGDGIGLEVMREAKRVLQSIERLHGGIHFDVTELPWGCRYYLKHHRMMPPDGMAVLADCDAILLGAVGYTGVPDHVSLRGLLLPIRREFDQYVNLRPIRYMDGMVSPLALRKGSLIDFTVIRENTEGEYCGIGRLDHAGTDQETAIQEARFTRTGTGRIIRYAFEFARKHGRSHLVSATKSNALNYSMVFWDRIFDDIRGDYPEIDSRSVHVDALSGLFILKPEMFDVVVASNLFGDILTDLGSAILGSIGISPSANINPEKTWPSMFEPVHGSAPDIAGQGIANPIGMLWSTVLMLDHLGLPQEGDLLFRAMGNVISNRRLRTPDLGGVCTTSEVTDAVIAALPSPGKRG